MATGTNQRDNQAKHLVLSTHYNSYRVRPPSLEASLHPTQKINDFDMPRITACGLLKINFVHKSHTWSNTLGALTQLIKMERRVKARYPLELNVRYHTLGRSNPVYGVGRTLNLSSNGALVASPDKMTEGVRLKLTIEWPSLLNGTTPLQLVTYGKVVRSSEDGFAVALETYQFRTMKRNLQPITTAVRIARINGATLPDELQRVPPSMRRDPPLAPASLIAKPL
jgi:hypothetical protein